MTLAEFWPLCLSRLQQQLPVQQYRTWVAPLTVGEEQGQWVVYAPTNFIFGWIKTKFWAQIEAARQEIARDGPDLVLKIGQGQHLQAAAPPAATTAPSTPPGTTQAATGDSRSASDIIQQRLNETGSPATTAPGAPTANKRGGADQPQHRLRADHTFDTLVVGRGNEVAVAVARNIAEHPGSDYNPFFLYSNPGLGKTHLVQAIGHALLQKQPQARVAYVHADDYVRSLMNAARTRTFDTFKQKYKPYDLLILDDVQFIANKDRTMEEFFYLFNHFYTERKQIILTSDELPENIEGMDMRLKTRFSSGLTLRLEPPELEMRVAILQKKAELAGIRMDEDAAFFIAKHIQGNVRALEGAFNRVAASSRFTGRPVNIDLAAAALQDIVASSYKVITVDMIMDEVSKYYRIGITDLIGKKRTRNIVRPRQLAMTLTKELTNLSLPAIGNSFGGRDHTTVMHAVKTVAQLRKDDPETEQDYQKLLILIKN